MDGRCTYFNRRWLEFTGRTLEQELGNGWAGNVHPDDLQRIVDSYLKAFEARQDFATQFRLRHADGEYRWVLDVGTPYFSSSGTFLGYIGSCMECDRAGVVRPTTGVLAPGDPRRRPLAN